MDDGTAKMARPAASPEEVSEAALRTVLGRFATGVAVVTGLDGDAPVGLAVNSFASVSLWPPLVSFCIAHTSLTWPRLRRSERICVNVLGDAQHAASRRMASSGGDKFTGLLWTSSPAGAPVLDGVIAWLECSIEAHHPAGDHDIVVARVHHFRVHGTDGPLLFFRGRYGTFTPHAESSANASRREG